MPPYFSVSDIIRLQLTLRSVMLYAAPLTQLGAMLVVAFRAIVRPVVGSESSIFLSTCQASVAVMTAPAVSVTASIVAGAPNIKRLFKSGVYQLTLLSKAVFHKLHPALVMRDRGTFVPMTADAPVPVKLPSISLASWSCCQPRNDSLVVAIAPLPSPLQVPGVVSVAGTLQLAAFTQAPTCSNNPSYKP